MAAHKLYGFTGVDQSGDPNYFIHFLDAASAEASFQAYKRQTFALLDLKPGDAALEVGCGTGDDARAMAQLVAPGGKVVAIDTSQAMLAEAEKRSAASGLPLEFRTGDAHRLEFADNTFDACRCDRCFMHMDNPAQAVVEMKRVTNPGGRVLVYEVDFETLVIAAPDRGLARKIAHTWTDSFRNGWLGRYVPAFFRNADLVDIQVMPATLQFTDHWVQQFIGPTTVELGRKNGTITEEEGAAWLAWLDAELRAKKLFSCLTGFIVSGKKPT